MKVPTPEFWRGRRVAVTGGAGFLGRALVQHLKRLGPEVRIVRSHEHDLQDPHQANAALEGAELVFHLAAVFGGIGFNGRNPARLAHDNLIMAGNVFESARITGVQKLVAACTASAYPRNAPTPFNEDDLWDGYPEVTNAPYGLSKKMMVVLSDAYRRQYEFNSCVLLIANLYGPGASFDLEDSHVIPAMIRRFAEAAARNDREVTLWGSGRPLREFLHIRDAARGLILAAEHLDSSEPINLGTGAEISIRELAEKVAHLTGFRGQIVWDLSQPDGEPSRGLDVSRIRSLLGFEPEIDLTDGLQETVSDFRARPDLAAAPR